MSSCASAVARAQQSRGYCLISSVAQLDSEVAVQAPRLSILHVTAPAAFGGLERVVEALASGHAARGHVVHVAAVIGPPDAEPDFAAGLRARGVGVHVLRVGARAYRAERAFVRKLCRAVRPDVVHTHGFRSDVVDGGVARGLGLPTVTTVHGFTRGAGRGRLYEWLQRRSHSRFDAVVAVSEAQTRELMAAGVEASRLQVIRNAWSQDRDPLTRGEARRVLDLPPDAAVLGWVGRLSPEKGPDLFIEAFARCADPRLRACIIGDGKLRGALTEAAQRLGVAERVCFIGQLTDAGRYFRAFDVFVMSSHTEGAPIVLFEAMAAQVPVVATSVGGIPEIAGEGEVTLVPSGDADALARSIQQLLLDPDRRARQIRRASETLRVQHGANQWLEAYQQLYCRLTLKHQPDSTISR